MLKIAFTGVFIISIIGVTWSSCPKGWAEYNNNCYWQSTASAGFDLARSVCNNYGGDLMTINSVEERDFVEKIIGPREHDVWFGLRQNPDNPADWQWTDNSSPGPLDPSLVKWSCEARPEAVCNEGESLGACGSYIWFSLLWQNQPCEWNKVFMCKRSKDVVDKCEIPTWHQYAGKCYRAMEEVSDWTSARTKCTDMAGNLVILKDQNHIDAFNHLQLCIDYQLGVWIGLSDVDTDNPNTLKWVDGSDGTSGAVTNWGEGQPPGEFPNDHKSNCVVSYAIDNHKWRVIGCGTGNRYMCEKNEGVCADGWEDYGNGYCYLVVSAPEQHLTWKEAKDRCAAYGYTATLLKIQNQQEQDILKNNIFNRLKDAGTPNVRIGASDEQVDNQFRWPDNTPLSYVHQNESWVERVPDRLDCGYVPTTDSNPESRWGAGYCFDKMAYICRINIYTSPNPVVTEVEQDAPDESEDEYICNAGWEKWNNECYLFDDSTLVYAEAKARCEEHGSNSKIITIRSSDEQAFVSNRLRGQTWLGLVYSEGRWIWDGTQEEPGFKNWANGGRNEQDTKTCCELQQNPPGQWYNAHCTESQFKFICRQPTFYNGTSAPTTPPPPTYPVHPECGAGWNYDQVTRRCFSVEMGSLVTWELAHQRCLEKGGDLVSITGQNEQTYINALLSSTVGGAVHYWIGLNDRDLEKGWRWSDGSGVAYFNWNAGEPNNWSGEEWCVEISPNYDGRWNDHNCSSSADGYICKKLGASELTTTAVPTTGGPPQACTDPQAMVSGSMYVQDQYIGAVTQKEGNEAWKARTNSGSSWKPTESNVYQYIEVHFPFPRMVSKIWIAGAPSEDLWVTQFEVLYKIEEGSRYHSVINSTGQTVVFQGNTAEDKNGGVARDFPEMLYAQAVRIRPLAWNTEIAMRFDVHGCRWEQGLCHYWEVVDGETVTRDEHMTASGSKEGREPNQAKMDRTGWEANDPFESGQWLQMQFDSHFRVMEIITAGHSTESRFVKSYKVQMYNPNSPEGGRWETYQDPYGEEKTFQGNTNNVDKVSNRLNAELYVSMIRIIPQEYEAGKSMRVEVKACPPGCKNIWLINGPQHSVEDSALTAGSSYDANHGPHRSRLFTVNEGDLRGAWCSLSPNQEEYIQADLGYTVSVKGITLQGRYDYDQWVKKYKVQYSTDGEDWRWVTWDGENQTVLIGDWSRNTLRTSWFPYAHLARYVRLRPTEWQNNICLRWDIQGCPGPYSSEIVGCYADTVEERDLPYSYLSQISGGMTHEACVYHCHSLGYLFAGVQYSIECMCGNSYGRYGHSSQCNMPCDGDQGQICGGHLSNTVLTTGLSPATTRCPDGWEEFDDSCYMFQVKTGEAGFSWETGQAICRQQNADLASINSEAENNFIMSRLAEYEENGWIGLHAKALTYTFEWSNYDDVDYTNWARREPNNIGGEEDCVNIYFYDGTWNDDSCTSNIYGAFVCESSKQSLPPATSPAPDPGCGAGWTPYRWKCYQILTNRMNWNDQRKNCEGWGDGVTLARIKDSQEQAFLTSKIAGYDYMFYTDVNDEQSPGTFTFTDGSSPPVTFWAANRPNSPNDATGVALSGSENGLWYDFPVGDVHGAICEKLSTTETQGPTDPTAPVGGTCPNGWEEYNNYCYLIKFEKQAYRVTWDDANYYCTSRGADLVSIHSQEENDFLWKFHIMDGQANYWTGLYRASSNESFKWSDGEGGVEYLPWDENFPQGGTWTNCVQIMYESGKWRNQACTDRKSWICKIRAGIALSTIVTDVPPTPGPDGSCAPDSDEWKYYNEKCYYFGNSKSWYDAGSWCNQNGGHLASIHDLDTNRFIEGQVRGQNSWLTWIGLNDIDGSESWSDGTPLDFTHYAEGQPDDSGTKLCAGIGSNSENFGKWIHDHCSKWFNFVCAKTKGGTTVTTPQPTPMPGGCPENYIAYRDKCIGLFSDSLTWQQARDKCYEMHKPYSLVSISNQYEQAYITALLKNNQHDYWIGLRYDTSTSTFYWTDNTQIKYTNWAPNEPNGGGGEQCVHLYADEQKAGKWNDLNCENTKPYICMTFKGCWSYVKVYCSISSTHYDSSPWCPYYKNSCVSDPALEAPAPITTCPEYGENYVLYDEDCYKGATGNLRTWQEADDHCKEDDAEYGRLTSIMSVYEQAFLLSTYLDHKDEISTSSKLWIGLTDAGHEGRFVWSDDRTVIYTNWANDQPNQPGGGCAYQEFSSGKWVDAPCSDTNYAICKISKKDKVYTRAPVGSCPGSERGRDWIEFGPDCYMFIDEAKTFADARHDCQMMHAELVSIHSKDENDFLDAHIQDPGFVGMWWLGFIRTISGSFQWTDDTAVNFLYWSEGEPSDNGTAGENCCEMYPHNGRWNDINCENTNGYICKIPRDLTNPNPSTTLLPSFPSDTVPSPTGTIVTPLTTKGPTDPPTLPPNNSPSTTSPPEIEEPNGGDSLSPGAGVGIAFAVIALVLLMAVIGLVIYRRQQWKKYASALGGVENQLYGSGDSAVQAGDTDA